MDDMFKKLGIPGPHWLALVMAIATPISAYFALGGRVTVLENAFAEHAKQDDRREEQANARDKAMNERMDKFMDRLERGLDRLERHK